MTSHKTEHSFVSHEENILVSLFSLVIIWLIVKLTGIAGGTENVTPLSKVAASFLFPPIRALLQ